MVVFVALLIRLFPQIVPLLPFGGLDELQQGNNLVTATDLVNLITLVVTAIIVIVKFSLALALSVFFVFTALALEPLVTENTPKQSDEDQEVSDCDS